MALNWSFSTYTFPIADSPSRGQSGDWNDDEKLVEHEPLNADATILTSWGFKSRRRTIIGTCGQTTRDQIRVFHRAATVAALTDPEGRSFTARIVRADFSTILPTDLYNYSIEFMER